MVRYTVSVICAIAVGVAVVFSIQQVVKWASARVGEVLTSRSIDLVAGALESSLTSDEVNENLLELEEDPVSVIESSDGVFRAVTRQSAITARSYAVLDLSLGKPLAEKDAMRALPIASLTKLVTAVVARTIMDQTARIEVTQSMLSTYGNTAKLKVGEVYRVNELLYPLLMVSSNDASEVLARSYGRKEFVRAMNEWANSIGAYNTYFADPSGLSEKNVASARDVAIIMRWIALNEPDILDITRTKVKNLRTHTWVNPTHLLNLTAYRGGKNGYTIEAGRTGVSVFDVNKNGVLHSYVIVVLNSKNRDHDTLDLIDMVSGESFTGE